MKSVMRHQFSEVPGVQIQRSSFDRSHGYKTTFDAGYLVPFLVDEVLPGDTFNVNCNGFARLSTPIYPIMDNIKMETFYFFVPYRLLWDNWKKFMGERVNPTDNIDYTIPQIQDLNNAANQTIYDYMGIPTQVAANLEISALPFRAYALIWNEWFRDENLQNSIVIPTGNGPDPAATYQLLQRGKRHDYFTSGLPWVQKGDPVQISLGQYAPVLGIGKVNTVWGVGVNDVHESDNTHSSYHGAQYIDSSNVDNQFAVEMGYDDVMDQHKDFPFIRADLSQAIGPNVNDLREAVQMQRILEKDARAGTRYWEIVNSHFGVEMPHNLYRPEYLGGGSSDVHISPIANTSNTGTGKLGAMGVAAFSGHGFQKSFVEHGIVIGLVNVRADLSYQEGLERMWSRESRYDFYWPSLANLGEQAILNKEIYVSAATLGDGSSEDVFAYQERYAEYRYKPSKITGKFRSNDATSLDSWHLAIEFGAQPVLNAAFIVDNPPIDRVIATPAEPHFIFDSYIQMRCARPMPIYSVPGLIDHF